VGRWKGLDWERIRHIRYVVYGICWAEQSSAIVICEVGRYKPCNLCSTSEIPLYVVIWNCGIFSSTLYSRTPWYITDIRQRHEADTFQYRHLCIWISPQRVTMCLVMLRIVLNHTDGVTIHICYSLIHTVWLTSHSLRARRILIQNLLTKSIFLPKQKRKLSRTWWWVQDQWMVRLSCEAMCLSNWAGPGDRSRISGW
jgi:hypothetical protein